MNLRRSLVPAVAGAAVALAAGGVVWTAAHAAAPQVAETVAASSAPVAASAVSTPAPVAASQEPSGPQPLPRRTLVPVRLAVPAIGVDAALDPLVLSGSGLQKPPHWNRPGWYADGAVPGEVGPAVIAGHVDSPSGPAVFWRLRELGPGDRISVTRSDGTVARFRVTRVEQAAKNAFPSAEVYGPTPEAELRLITCAGVYDKGAGGYRDNRIVFARAE